MTCEAETAGFLAEALEELEALEEELEELGLS